MTDWEKHTRDTKRGLNKMSPDTQNLQRITCVICVTFFFLTKAQSTVLAREADNAALLYYQALLVWPEPGPDDEVTFLVLDEVAKGAEPNESVKKYLSLPQSRAAIELVREATKMPSCDWGPLCPGEYGPTVLSASLQRLSRFMQVYAHDLAARGDFRLALEHCIGMQRFASHIGSETSLMFSLSRMVNGRALTSVRHILGSMPLDVPTLTWLKDHLVPSNVSGSRIVATLRSNCSLHLQFMRDHPNAYGSWWKEYPQATADPNARNAILERAGNGYSNHLESTLKILKSDLPHERKKAELRNLIARIEDQIENRDDDNDYFLILGDCIPYIESCYDLTVRDAANYNALTVALEVYLIAARTGHIPEKLPGNQAKDPYSGKDFAYKVTDEGFALRYRDEMNEWAKSRWLEFKVKRQ